MFLGVAPTQIPQNVFGTTHTYCLPLALLRGIGHDNLINVLEGCLVFFILAAWILFTFYLKQKKTFSV